VLRTIGVITDYDNLKFFLTIKKLLGRQARVAEALLVYNIEISFRAGKKNLANGLSRRLDYALDSDEDSNLDMLLVL